MDPGNASAQYSLAAIVFTDIVGFSRLMSENEAEALPRAKAELARLRGLCEQHNGKVLKSTGDGLLMHFTSAVQAVACALEIQRQRPVPDGQTPLQHRIGIHLGDVSLEDGDVMGDGVNIAARLQTQADPGGICISKTVYDVVKNRLAIQATFLGPRELKNISEAVPIYKILIEAQSGGQTRPVRSPKRRKWILRTLLVLLAIGIGIHMGRHIEKVKEGNAAPAPLSTAATRFIGAWEMPQRQSVMVFRPDGHYGVDLAMGDHKILGLVGTWQADDKSITTVRTDPPKTTVNHLLSVTDSQLIIQRDQGYLYLERIPMPNLPTVTITGISTAMARDPHPKIVDSTDTFPAAQSYNLGVAAYNNGDYDQAISRFTEALALKPDFDLAFTRRAESYEILNTFDKALADYTQVVADKPRDANALANRAVIHLKLGQYQAALDDTNNALTLNPNYFYALNVRGRAYLLLGQYPQAIADLNAALAVNPASSIALIDRGVAKKASGDLAGGQADLDQARALQTAPPITPTPTPTP